MNADLSQDRIRKVLSGVLVPLARILLRCGVSYAEFAELSKRAFVEAASRDYGVRKRPTNIARVAVMTGLSRKEVSRLRKEGKQNAVVPASYRNFPAEILHRWYTDPNFLDRTGHPRALVRVGSTRSFAGLVRTVTSDIPPRALERELTRAGALKITGGNKLLPVGREFVPEGVTEKVIEGLQYGIRRLMETVSYNADPQNRKNPRFQRIVHTDAIPASEIRLVRDSIAAILSGFATQVDDYLTKCQLRTKRGVDLDPSFHVGVGLYYFDNPDQQ